MARKPEGELLGVARRIAAALERLAPAAARAVDLKAGRVRLALGRRAPGTRQERQPRRHRAPEGDRPGPRHPAREHAALRRGPSRQQRPALGRPRHGKEFARQGHPRHRRCDVEGTAQARRDPSRGYRRPAPSDGPHSHPARRALYRLLRRSFLRRRRHELQVAEGRARRRHRRTPGEHDPLCDVEPPPPAAARNGGERAIDRHQPA